MVLVNGSVTFYDVAALITGVYSAIVSTIILVKVCKGKNNRV